MQYDAYRRSGKESRYLSRPLRLRLNTEKEMHKIRSARREVESIVTRLQTDVMRRQRRQHNIDAAADRGVKIRRAQSAMGGRRMSREESDRLYERLVDAKKESDLLVNEKRRLMEEIREKEEAEERNRTPRKSILTMR